MVTSLYAGILAILYLALTFFTIGGRFKHRVSLGDGGNPDMLKRIRAHANFAEYVPFALILMVLAEVEGVSEGMIHGLGISLVIGRLLHSASVSGLLTIPMGRQVGMVLTLMTILISAILCMKSYFIF